MLFQSSAQAPVFHVNHWIRLSLCVLSVPLFFGILLCVSVFVYARQALNFYYISITLCILYVCLWLLSHTSTSAPFGTPVSRPQHCRGPSLQFAIVCHHLFVLTNKMLVLGPPPIGQSHMRSAALSSHGSITRDLFLQLNKSSPHATRLD